jgi:hypothetical protein
VETWTASLAKRPVTQSTVPLWNKILLGVLGCLLLGELVMILWAAWAILTFE